MIVHYRVICYTMDAWAGHFWAKVIANLIRPNFHNMTILVSVGCLKLKCCFVLMPTIEIVQDA